MNALTSTDADIKAGAFQADADQNGNTANPFAMWTVAAMIPMQMAMAVQQQIFEQVQPEIDSAVFFTQKSIQIWMKNIGLGS